MAINTSYNHVTGITYVYETTIEVDPATGKKQRKRKCIGKIDEKTGQMVPTEKRSRRSQDFSDQSDSGATDADDFEACYRAESRSRQQLESEAIILQDKVRSALAALKRSEDQLAGIKKQTDQAIALLEAVLK